jgi:two-component system response regulator (stage 0 sporulation protein F)
VTTPHAGTPAYGGGSGKPLVGPDTPRRILLVDDDAEMRALLVDVLRDEGFEVLQAANGAEALLVLHREVVAAIVLDKNMPGLSGMELLPGLHVICPRTPVIIITAFGDERTAEETGARGGAGVLFKPFRMDDLCAMLHQVLSAQESPTRPV